MINEKDLKLTINKLWNEIKEVDLLKQPLAINFIYSRTIQIFALMKVLQRNEIFTKIEIQSYDLLKNLSSKEIKEELQEKTKQQLKLSDIPDAELQKFIIDYNSKSRKTRIISENELTQKPRI